MNDFLACIFTLFLLIAPAYGVGGTTVEAPGWAIGLFVGVFFLIFTAMCCVWCRSKKGHDRIEMNAKRAAELV
jgi:hypothetical protein